MSFDTITPVLAHIKAGKLRALAVTTAKRSAALPNVPTLDEAGLKGYDFSSWSGVLAPAGTPQDIVQKLNRQIASALDTPSVREKLMNFGYTPMSSSSQELQDTIVQDLASYKRMIKDLNISAN